jgi:hypothetical protein
MAEYPMLSARQRISDVIGEHRLSVHVLDGAEALPQMTLENLPLMAQALGTKGAVLVIEYDENCQCLRFHSQDEWLRGGRLVAR